MLDKQRCIIVEVFWTTRQASLYRGLLNLAHGGLLMLGLLHFIVNTLAPFRNVVLLSSFSESTILSRKHLSCSSVINLKDFN